MMTPAEFVIKEAELDVDDDDEWTEDEFEVEGFFVLGDDNNGIDVPKEDVTVVFGTFSYRIRPAPSCAMTTMRDSSRRGLGAWLLIVGSW